MSIELRLVGCGLIVLAGTVWGQSWGARYAGRCRDLEALTTAFELIEGEISSGTSGLAAVLMQAGDAVGGEVGRALLSAGERAAASRDPGGELLSQLTSGRLHLRREDVVLLAPFLDRLGALDRKTQLKQVKNIKGKLSVQGAMARDQRRRCEQLYRALGPLAGLALAIMLI